MGWSSLMEARIHFVIEAGPAFREIDCSFTEDPRWAFRRVSGDTGVTAAYSATGPFGKFWHFGPFWQLQKSNPPTYLRAKTFCQNVLAS